MSISKVTSALKAVSILSTGDTVVVNSSSGLCCPDAVLKALGELFTEEASQTEYDTAISGESIRPLESLSKPTFDVAKIIARRVAQELRLG